MKFRNVKSVICTVLVLVMLATSTAFAANAGSTPSVATTQAVQAENQIVVAGPLESVLERLAEMFEDYSAEIYPSIAKWFSSSIATQIGRYASTISSKLSELASEAGANVSYVADQVANAVRNSGASNTIATYVGMAIRWLLNAFGYYR